MNMNKNTKGVDDNNPPCNCSELYLSRFHTSEVRFLKVGPAVHVTREATVKYKGHPDLFAGELKQTISHVRPSNALVVNPP